MRKSALVPLCLLVWGVGSGCPRHAPPAPPPSPAIPSLDAISNSLARFTGCQALDALFKLDLETPQGRHRLNGALLVEKNEGIRVEVFSMIGPPVGYGAMTPEQWGVYLPLSDNLFLQTMSPDAFLAQVTGGVFGTRDLVGLLLGRFPPCRPIPEVGFEQALRMFEVTCLGDAGGRFTLWLDPDTLQVRTLEVAAGPGRPGLTCRLEDYRDLGGTLLPYRIALQVGNDLQVGIQYTQVDPEPALRPGVFHVDPPEGARVVPLESVVVHH